MPEQPVLPGGGPQVTVDAALNNPRIVARAIQSIALDRFLADKIFASGGTVTGGATLFARNESRFMDRDPKEVSPRTQYPRAGWTSSIFAAYVHKYGLEVPISDETRRRNALDEMGRAQTRLANSVVRFVDGLAVNLLLNDDLIPHNDAAGDWAASGGAAIIGDIAAARAAILNLDQGYVPDTLVINPDQELAMMLSADIRAALPRETGSDNAVLTGRPVPLLGLTIVISNKMPAGTSVVLEAKTVGTIADEQPDPAEKYSTYTPPAGGAPSIYVKTYRNENVDETIVRAARFPAMWITDPFAAYVIDGTDGTP